MKCNCCGMFEFSDYCAMIYTCLTFPLFKISLYFVKKKSRKSRKGSSSSSTNSTDGLPNVSNGSQKKSLFENGVLLFVSDILCVSDVVVVQVILSFKHCNSPSSL